MEQTTEPPVGDNIRDKGDKQGKKDSGVSWQQDNEHVNGRDLPSSTPAAPSLNVPIVTRTGRGAEVHQLFDERTATNRVSGTISLKTTCVLICRGRHQMVTIYHFVCDGK